jgi:D-alanyl-D-alanine carboxypeptidase/D-alanyl-D-alanine-endopeptidase (penicillin-binding protein 4)
MRPGRVSTIVLLVGLTALPPSAAQPPAPRETDTLPRRLRAVIDAAELGEGVGVHVVHAQTGREIFRYHSDLALNPASNMKLVTAAAALLRLGPGFTMQTGLYGRVEDGAVEDLAIRGFADPTLRMSDLVELAEGLRDRGVRRVGAVIVDGRYFDDAPLPPAFEQQPDEVAAFRAAIAAVSVERSAYVLRVIPGAAQGRPAEVRLAAAGYFELTNEIRTTEGGSPAIVAVQRGDGDQMSLTVRGTIPLGLLGVSYRRRVENPLAYAGHALVEALGRAGIRASGRVRIGATPDGSPMLVSRSSAPLSEMLGAMGRWSDNFTAEMVLKVLGAERARPGTTARGCEVVQDVLTDAGVPEGAATCVNGSGLFEGNRVAPSHLTTLLSHVYRNPAVRAEYLAHLAVGGSEGTLRRRLTDLPAPRIVRMKTGTLNDVIGLSGYVLGPTPDGDVAFSFLANGIRGRQGAARNLADDLVRAVAADLHR